MAERNRRRVVVNMSLSLDGCYARAGDPRDMSWANACRP